MNARYSTNLHLVYKRAFVIYSGSVLRNSLPLEVRQLTSLNVFKPTLKTFISIAKLLKLAIRNFYTRPPCIAGFLVVSFLYLNENVPEENTVYK